MLKFQFLILSCLCLTFLSGCGYAVDSIKNFADQAEQIQDTATNTANDSNLSSTFTGLLNQKWQLIELNGVPVDAQNSPYIQFSPDSKITGFAGCNNFFGTYEVEQPLQLKFSDLGSTMMYCEDTAQLEDEFMAVFPQVDNFTLSQDSQELSLNKAKMAPLARFSAVE